MLLGLVGGQDVDGALVERAEVEHDGIDSGEEEQLAGTERRRQGSGRVILVDDTVHGRQGAVRRAAHGDPAPTGRQHDVPGIEQQTDRLQFHDVDRDWRGDHPAVTAPGVIDDLPPPLASQPAGPLRAEERPDRLGRVIERRIGRVDHDMGDECHGRARAAEPIDLADEHATELTLGHRAELVQRLRGHQRARLVLLDRQVSDLRAVAVHDRDPPSLLDQPGQARRHLRSVADDLLGGAGLVRCSKGVSPDRDDREWSHGTGKRARPPGSRRITDAMYSIVN
jgi:hypothetical protein